MKINELRIGNHMQDKKGRLCEVLRLSKDIDEVRISAIDGAITSLPIQPIPLTPFILIDYGFEETEGKYQIPVCKSYLFLRPSFEGGYYYGINSSDCSFCEFDDVIPIKYVHQLQNLYYSMSLQELLC